MSRDKRLQEITDILQNRKRIDVKQLEKLTFSSTSTLRRDLIFLEEQGLIKRKHGEVILNSFNTVELAHSIRETENRSEKKIIADLAFCSARGIDGEYVYEASFSQASAKKTIIDKAKETILLIDSSKFRISGFFKINNLKQYKTIISDKFPDESLLTSAEKYEVEWIANR